MVDGQPHRAHHLLAVSLVGLVVVGLAACGGSGSSSSSPAPSSSPTSTPTRSAGPGPASAIVRIASFNYTPAMVTVRAGGTVTWRNDDPYAHTASIASGGQGPAQFTTGTLNKQGSKTVTFAKSGTYSYVCLFHQFMHGTVVVR